MANCKNNPKLRAIYDKTDGVCAYCGRLIHPYCDDWEVDHAIPKSQGGTDDLDNLWPACRKCNRKKRDTTPEGFSSLIRNKLSHHTQAIDDLLEQYGYCIDNISDMSESLDKLKKSVAITNISFFKDQKQV